ncbi:MAG: T9SS type A sorting domain-containing protein [Bacteroidales bacterium]|nr:T9SS type A sorting domain-containing protein [Bacteroidales bacterium]
MKKLFPLLLLIAMLSVAGYAQQSISLYDKLGNLLTNSTVLINAGTPDSTLLITYVDVKNTSDHPLSIFSKKVEVSLLANTEVTMCWAGSCYPANVFVSPNAKTLAPGEISTEFSGDYATGGQKGLSIVRYVFFDLNYPNDSACITVNYTTYPTGVESVESIQGTLSAGYPNPANSNASFNYSLPSGNHGQLIIRNLVGATVRTEDLGSSSGKITVNTSSLNDGIYFSSLSVDGKVVATKKMVINH